MSSFFSSHETFFLTVLPPRTVWLVPSTLPPRGSVWGEGVPWTWSQRSQVQDLGASAEGLGDIHLVSLGAPLALYMFTGLWAQEWVSELVRHGL